MTQSTTAEASPPDPAPLPYDEIGGTPAVRALVERFYDLMEQDPRFAELRAIHAPDLAPMRESLTGFLTAWLGGPRDWFTQKPGACIMSAHRQIGFGAVETEQWTQAMTQALIDTGVKTALAEKMNVAFARMGRAMQGD
ncbi:MULTISPECIES: group II truncated hemoglobin [unclassified Sphingobium]|uniref:group II truncated hemoglobin n=1 Tax=unclassified Sphingobium TaxID=2611147 RepID=UPI002224557C|nr:MULTISPECIES: group II truncated hemoglobin [unclassified Sphingobium]MCW2413226.1 hemoglobin [Sphingobium sp. B8D3D]MCW2414476.1 hemoglobin [Sphingobium sp. B8D3A]